MPLTLRPTGLSSPAYADKLDYVVCEDGKVIGPHIRRLAHAPRSAVVLVHHRVRRSEAGHQYERARREPR